MILYMNTLIRAALKDPKGVSALEYAILAAGILGAIAGVMTTLGSDITSVFTAIGTKLTTATSSG